MRVNTVSEDRLQKKVLVTGGAGFIGSHLVDLLTLNGYNVRIIDNLSTGSILNIKQHLIEGNVELIKGDIRDLSIMEKSLQDIDIVVHLAALTSVPYSVRHPDITFEINTNATTNLLSLCEKIGVEKFIFASSCAVYGDTTHLPVNEDEKTNPLSPYAESKLKVEQKCLNNKAFTSIVLRFFNVYGPRQGISEYSGVITRFVKLIENNKPLTIFGTGSQTRDFVNVHDITRAILLVLKSEAKSDIFNIGSGRQTSINELAELIINLTNSNRKITYLPERSGDIRESYANILKAKKILNYVPEILLSDGLSEYLLSVNTS